MLRILQHLCFIQLFKLYIKIQLKMINSKFGLDQPYIRGSDIILKIAQTNTNKSNQQSNSQQTKRRQANKQQTNNHKHFNVNNQIQPNTDQNNSLQINKQNGVQRISKNILQERQFREIVFELDLKVNLQNQSDCLQLKKILFDILKYPSSKLAQLHAQANRLGNFDLPQQKQKSYQLFDRQENQDKQYCPCCGFIRQEDQLKICSEKLQDVQNIGVSTYLYFRSVLNIIILLIAMFLIYGIYAIITNIIASKDAPSIANQNYLILSMGSKQLNATDKNQRLVFIQAWIGFIMVITWGFLFYYLQKVQRQKQEEVSRQSITAADFSVLIQNLPLQMDQISLQKQFDQYCKKNQGVKLKITAYNEGKPFYLNEAQIYNERVKQILEQQAVLHQKIVELILQRQQSQHFTTLKQERQNIFFEYRRNQQNKKNEYERAITEIQSKLKKNNVLSTTTAFVSFQTNKQKEYLTKGSNDRFYTKLKQIIPCAQNEKKFLIKLKKHNSFDESLSYAEQHKVNIQKAPQPQDVEWSNIGISDCELIYKKSVTYTITGLMLGTSFIIVYGLSLIQINNSSSRFLSFFISFVISLINIIISQVIRKLCLYQRNLTKTRYQTSLALKSIFAQLINSILIPIMTNRFIKNNIYQPNGLVDDIFLLGITNAFLSPILKIFDTYYYYVRFMAWYTNRATYKLQLSQRELNEYTSYIQFQVGYQYIYIINLFLFTCFFVSLQPVICVFSIFGLLLMFWAQKYSLFARCRRPVPGTSILHAYLTQLIYLGGLAYSLGSLMWSNFLPEGIPKNALIPNLFALGGGIIIILIPYRLISQLYKQQQNQQVLSYQQCKKFLPSEYDRLNPVTSHQAIQKFRIYMINQKQRLKHASTQVKSSVLKMFQKQGRHNHQYGYEGLNNMFKGELLNVLPMQNNSINPQFAANFLFSGQNNINSGIPALNQMLNFGKQVNLQNRNPVFKQQEDHQITNALFSNLGANRNHIKQNSHLVRHEDQSSGNELVTILQKGKLNRQNEGQ